MKAFAATRPTYRPAANKQSGISASGAFFFWKLCSELCRTCSRPLHTIWGSPKIRWVEIGRRILHFFVNVGRVVQSKKFSCEPDQMVFNVQRAMHKQIIWSNRKYCASENGFALRTVVSWGATEAFGQFSFYVNAESRLIHHNHKHTIFNRRCSHFSKSFLTSKSRRNNWWQNGKRSLHDCCVQCRLYGMYAVGAGRDGKP